VVVVAQGGGTHAVQLFSQQRQQAASWSRIWVKHAIANAARAINAQGLMAATMLRIIDS